MCRNESILESMNRGRLNIECQSRVKHIWLGIMKDNRTADIGKQVHELHWPTVLLLQYKYKNIIILEMFPHD